MWLVEVVIVAAHPLFQAVVAHSIARSMEPRVLPETWQLPLPTPSFSDPRAPSAGLVVSNYSSFADSSKWT